MYMVRAVAAIVGGQFATAQLLTKCLFMDSGVDQRLPNKSKANYKSLKTIDFLACPAGIEPATLSLEG